MRIAIATPSLNPRLGGPAYSVPAISKNLHAIGVDSVVLTQDDRLRDHAGASASVWHLLSSQIVHNFGIWTPFHHTVCVAARASRRPMVCSPMGMLEPWSLAQKSIRKRIALSVYQRRDLDRSVALHATAPSEAEHLRALGLKAPIAVISHGVDLPPLPVEPRHGRSLRRTALFLSRIHPKKGLLALVEAWCRLRPEGWRVVIAGHDEQGHQAKVEEAVVRARLQDYFEFTGPVAGGRKRALLLEADLFVLPTYSENFGNAIAEALAHEVPVITTTAAPWSAIQEARCGWWIEPGVDSLVIALREALAMPADTLRPMGERGRAMVSARYAWSRIADNYIELYQWILHGGAPPPFVRLG